MKNRKNKGWRNESERHALASRGIPTTSKGKYKEYPQLHEKISEDRPVRDVDKLTGKEFKEYGKFLEKLVEFLEQDLEHREDLIWDYEQALDYKRKSGEYDKAEKISRTIHNLASAFDKREKALKLAKDKLEYYNYCREHEIDTY